MSRIHWRRIAVHATALSAAVVGMLSTAAPSAPASPPAAAESAIGTTLIDGEATSIEQSVDGIPPGFDARTQAVEKELAGLSSRHPWAGEYYEGDGLGSNVRLSIAPDAGVTAMLTGCLGIYDANHGAAVERTDGLLGLNYVAPNDPAAGFPNALLPVAWGERRYLLRPDQLVAFASAINHGEEPRDDMHGLYLLRTGDAARAVDGLPALPPAALAVIRAQPVTLVVDSVELRSRRDHGDGWCDVDYRLRLHADGNADAPVAVGERLRQIAPHGYDSIDVLDTDAQRIEASLRTYAECDLVPAAGWRYTTGAYQPEKPKPEPEPCD